MRRHVPAPTHRARATKRVAPIDSKVLWQLTGLGETPTPQRRQPSATEVFAKKSQKARALAAHARSHPRKDALERVPETIRAVGHAPPQRHATKPPLHS